jgi:orotate phosphoribosyltransferase
VTDEELRDAIAEHALLHGDFVLRSGRRSDTYFDKYRFETRPELLGPIGERIAAVVAEHEPDAVRLAAPELGAVALAASASLAGGLPFVLVRKAAKEYGTSKRIEGVLAEGELVVVVEDVVTSGGALLESVEALRGAGAVVRQAVCVVDREEGGVDELARHAVRLRALFRAGEFATETKKMPQNRMVEPNGAGW